jgi:RNA polymerase sigma-70 factor (ECF subfamily)
VSLPSCIVTASCSQPKTRKATVGSRRVHVWDLGAPCPYVVHDAAVRVKGSEGLEGVYRDEASRLWRSLVAYSGDREIASDAVAEAFAQALRGGAAIREPDRWVWKVAFRVASGELKARDRIGEEAPELSYEMPDDALAMTALLRRLPTKQRAAVVLHYYADLPNERIAQVLGITTATVRVHLSQGRKRLKQLLEEESDV